MNRPFSLPAFRLLASSVSAAVLLALLLPVASALAQEETLIGDEYDRGGYGGLVMKAGAVNEEIAAVVGVRGAWILNHRFAIGGGFYGLATYVKVDRTDGADKSLYLDFAFGGFEMEYIYKSDKLIHWTTHVMIGGGTVDLVENNPTETVVSGDVFVIEPSLELDVNISTWLRIGFGSSYRQVIGLDVEEIEDGDLSGASGFVILKFGRF